MAGAGKVVEVDVGSDMVVATTDVLVGLGSTDVIVPTEGPSGAHPTTTIANAIQTRDTRMDRDGSGAPRFE